MKKFFLQFSLAFSLFLARFPNIQTFLTKYNNNKIEWKILRNKKKLRSICSWADVCIIIIIIILYSMFSYPSSSNGFNTLYYIFFMFSHVFSSSHTFYILRFILLFLFFHSLFDCYGDIVTWQMFFISFSI